MLIIHGEDQISSRQYFLDQKKKYLPSHYQLTELTDEDFTFDHFFHLSNSASLFGQKPVIIIEKLFSSRPNSQKNQIVDYLISHPDNSTMVWEDRDISSKIKGLSPSLVKNFSFPKTIWTFLDNISVKNYYQALISTPAEIILSLLAKRIHDLILIHNHIPMEVSPWQLSKLQSQASKYSLKQLFILHRNLLIIDYRQKTSNQLFGLSHDLELWITKVYYFQ